MSQWRAAIHSFQGNSQRGVLHACQFIQLVVITVAFVCAWWLHAEFVPFDYAVSVLFFFPTSSDDTFGSNFGPNCITK